MKASGCLWNALTVVMLGLTALACVWMGAVFVNPQGLFNPFRPLTPTARPTASPIGGTPTAVLEFPTLPPAWTATFTPTAGTLMASATPARTATRVPSSTVPLSPVGPTATESETPIVTATSTPPLPTNTPVPAGYPGTVAVPTATLSSGYP